MAPEQMQGARDIDQRADLYSVGVILYEMLTGEIPSGRFALPGELNSGLPAAIDDLIDKVLQQHPAKRHVSAKELAEALKAVGTLEADPVVETALRDDEFEMPPAEETLTAAETEMSYNWDENSAAREDAFSLDGMDDYNANAESNVRDSINIPDDGAEKSFLARLYNGEFGFVKTFWIYFFVANILLSAISLLNLQLSVLVNIITFFYFLFMAICVWNSAKKYNGNKIWVWIAIGYILLGSIQKLSKSFHVISLLSRL